MARLRSPIEAVKARLRPTAFYKPFLRRNVERQLRHFVDVREDAYRRAPDAFAPPGIEARSRELLHRRFSPPAEPKKDPRDVRLFLLDHPGMGGPWFESDVARTFDVAVFSITRHSLGFAEGAEDLVAYASGIDPDDRSRIPRGVTPEQRPRLQDDVFEAVARAHEERPIDLCFAYASAQEFDAETIRRIRALGIPVSMWTLDEKHSMVRLLRGGTGEPEPLMGEYDIHLTNSFDCLRWYLARGVPAFYLPQAIDPELYAPRDVRRDIPVSFVGAAYGQRFEFIRRLRRAGLPLECFGPGWPNGPVDDLIDVICRSRINLGAGYTGMSGDLTCVKERDFQVPATGSMYLTTYDPELTRLFHVGREFACYRNEMDCVELVRYYLEQPDEVAEMGRAGRERCLRDHTWRRRLEGLLRWMGVLAAA